MLTGTLKPGIEYNYYPDIIKQLLSYFSSTDVSLLDDGKHILPFLDESKAWFILLSYQTAPFEQQKPEVHHHFSDLQIILSGREKMAWCIDEHRFQCDGEYFEQRDIQYYQVAQESLNLLSAKPGQFYLFTPSVVHMTNIEDPSPCFVRKLVVKIHNSLLLGE